MTGRLARWVQSVAMVAMVAMLCPRVASAGDPPTLRFGAGSKTGGFTKTANALSEALEATGDRVRIDINHTKGSCDNIRRLIAGELDVALVQYDVAAEAFSAGQASRELAEGGEPGEDEDTAGGGWMCEVSGEAAAGVDIELVAAVTDAAVHVVVRRPVRLDDFQTIGDRPVFLGQDGSGSLETSKSIIGAAGLTLEDVNRPAMKTSEAMGAMARGELLMMLRTTAPGSDAMGKLMATGRAAVNALPGDVLERLIDGFPYYRVCQIEAGAYPGLEFAVPTVCVSTVVVTAHPRGEPALRDEEVQALLDAFEHMEDVAAKDPEAVQVDVQWRGFAEREPIPLHTVASHQERIEFAWTWARLAGWLVLLGGVFMAVRWYLRRRGYLKDPLAGNLEGQLSNPLIPFAGFLVIVLAATVLVWKIESDSNARVRTLNDSFWEMNMFATGNFDSESLKTSTARTIGAVATIAGLGLLAWFTAALTSLLSQDQMRVFRRLRNHIVILNFREDMLQLIRVLRSPGPLQQRPIHVVVSDELPPRVRAQLARVRGLTVYHQNPEVPEDLVSLRIPRAARVIVLGSGRHENEDRLIPTSEPQYHPLRIARAVHQACVHLDPMSGAMGPALRSSGFSISPTVTKPATGGDQAQAGAGLPVALVEAGDREPVGVFAPFSSWLIPVPARRLADEWLANTCVDPHFGELFNGIVSFRDENSELYTVPFPDFMVGQYWRAVRRILFRAEGRAGVIPIGIYRGPDARHAFDTRKGGGDSPQSELERRLLVNPPLELQIQSGDRLVAFAEDEADLRKILRASKRNF